MRPITLQRLDVFRVVYEQASISAAARLLGLSQPTVSRHLSDFEAAIGMRLFTRNKGRLAATPEANSLYGECRFLGQGIARLESTIERIRRGEGWTMAIAAVGPLSHDILPTALQDTLVSFPGLTVSVGVSIAQEQVRALRSGLVDLGFVVGNVNCPDLHVEKIGQGNIMALVPREHALAEQDHLSHGDVHSHCREVMMSPSGPIGSLLAAALSPYTPDGLPRITVQSVQAAPQIAARLRQPVLTDAFSVSAFSDPSMVHRPIRPAIPFDVWAISTPRVARSPAAHRLIASMAEELARRNNAKG